MNLSLFVFGIVFIWLGIVTYLIGKISEHYKKLVNGTQKSSLMDVLDQLLKEVESTKKRQDALDNKVTNLITEVVTHLQKVKILRFNPFEDTGGDQSFVLTILDGRDNGIVLTSLHNRGITRWYAKNIKEGKGIDYELSGEEKNEIKEAQFMRRENPNTKIKDLSSGRQSTK